MERKQIIVERTLEDIDFTNEVIPSSSNVGSYTYEMSLTDFIEKLEEFKIKYHDLIKDSDERSIGELRIRLKEDYYGDNYSTGVFSLVVVKYRPETDKEFKKRQDQHKKKKERGKAKKELIEREIAQLKKLFVKAANEYQEKYNGQKEKIK